MDPNTNNPNPVSVPSNVPPNGSGEGVPVQTPISQPIQQPYVQPAEQPIQQPQPQQTLVQPPLPQAGGVPIQPTMMPAAQPKKSIVLKVILIVLGVIVGLFVLLFILGVILQAAGYKPSTKTDSKSSSPTSNSNSASSTIVSSNDLAELKAFGDQVLMPIKSGDFSTAYSHASDNFKKELPQGSVKYTRGFAAIRLFIVTGSGQPMRLVSISKTSADGSNDKNEYGLLYVVPVDNYTNPDGVTTLKDAYIMVMVTSDKKHFDTVLPLTGDNAKAASDIAKAPLEAAFKVNYPTATPHTVTEAQN